MKVQHDEARQAFTVDVEGEAAELTYTRPEDGVVAFDHTFVPPAGRDRGIGAEMARAALAWARQQGLKVVPTCPYVASFVKRNGREYGDLLK